MVCSDFLDTGSAKMRIPSFGWEGWDDVAPIRATAAFPRLDLKDAVRVIDAEGPNFKPIQLCPQNGSFNRSTLYDQINEINRSQASKRAFYLHGNHRLICAPSIYYDASTVESHWRTCFEPLSRLCKELACPVYSLHAGRKRHCSPIEIIRNVVKLERLFDCAIAIEGMYPSLHGEFHISSSEEYEWLLSSGVSMAIDVSHLNIVRAYEGEFDESLLDKLLQSERCLEIHISHNNGKNDCHAELPSTPPWWWGAVRRAVSARPGLPVFCESMAPGG
jgi:hypothetical protein